MALIICFAVFSVAIGAAEASGVFTLEMTAEVDHIDRSIINVTITAEQFQKAVNGVEFRLNFDNSQVSGVVTAPGASMDAFLTACPGYTMVVPGLQTTMFCYEQLCTYHPEGGYYICRFADLQEYPNAKSGELIDSGLDTDGEMVITIPFKIIGENTSVREFTFSVTDVRGTVQDSLRSVRGIGDELVYTVEDVCVPPEITAKSFSLSFEDEMLVNFYYLISDAASVSEHGMLVFDQQPASVRYEDAVDSYVGISDPVSGRFMATTDGISAKALGDTRYYAAYARLQDGTYVYSGVYDYSPRKYAENMLSKSTTTDKQKALCVAMLNYGAAAQKYFDYRPAELVNDRLTDAQRAMVVPYDPGLFTGAVAADSSKLGSFVATSFGFGKNTASVSFDSAFAINYYFRPTEAIKGDLILYYWTPEDYAAAEKLTAGNASGSCAMILGEDGSYWAQVSGIAAKLLDATYYVAAVYTDGSETYNTGVIAYSLSKYCMSNARDGKPMQELAAATAMYGYYAKLYFAK